MSCDRTALAADIFRSYLAFLDIRDPRLTKGIEVLKRAYNPLMNTLDDRFHGTRKMVSECVRKDRHLHKTLNTFRRRRLRESIRRKRPQFLQSYD
ncbi:hypothetical protein TNCV_4263331 [Trichonephila clavipes]|nr:hypothetical protein TNCV_4263331 [Trichonephila clavipes]